MTHIVLLVFTVCMWWVYYLFSCSTHSVRVASTPKRWRTSCLPFINCFLFKKEHFATPRERLSSQSVRLISVLLLRWDAVVRWLKVHYLVLPWMSYAKLAVFCVVIDWTSKDAFSALCFSVPTHHLLSKTNFQYHTGSPIKDLHCDSIFHFNYYTWCKIWRISLFIK